MSHPPPPAPLLGVFTRTVARGSAIKFILPAKLRRPHLNDVVFVGEDFVHAKEVCQEGGHLRPLVLKDDFNARIQSAKVLDTGRGPWSPAPVIKAEREDAEDKSTLTPQHLLLALDSGALILLHLQELSQGNWRFVQHALPLPRFEHRLHQPGEHLAVERRSRAVAVAARERELVVWSRSPPYESNDKTPDASLGQPRFFKIDGVITQMDFLTTNDEDHIVLLLVVLQGRFVKAFWIDWHDGDDLYQAHLHSPQALESATSVPSLLVPLCNAAFLLVCGKEIKRWKGLLSGAAEAGSYDIIPRKSGQPGSSPKEPLWAAWCRPHRSANATREKDYIYLAREDGLVYLLQISADNRVQASAAGDFQCHVGTAFASVGEERDPDVLIVAGDMSTGRVVSIGPWLSVSDIGEQTWKEAMEMDLVESIPNWTSVTDMVVTNLPHSQSRALRSRDGIFVASGKQPHGAVSELRQGYEAQQVLYFAMEEFGGVTDAWALPLMRTGSILVLLANPSSSVMLDVAADGRESSVFEPTPEVPLIESQRTIALASMQDGRYVQVTDSTILMTAGFGNDDHTARVQRCEPGTLIVGAAISTEHCTIFTIERSERSFSLRVRSIAGVTSSNDNGPQLMDVDGIPLLTEIQLQSEILAVTSLTVGKKLYAVCTCADGSLRVFTRNGGIFREAAFLILPSTNEVQVASDHLATLTSPSADKALILCSLRNGRILSVALDDETGSVSLQQTMETQFGVTSAKLKQLNAHTVCAMSGLDTCHLTWNGSSTLSVHSVLITDKDRPDLDQDSVGACTQTPSEDFLSSRVLADKLLVVSGQDVSFTSLIQEVTTIPRHIAVSGSPSRVIYSEHLRSLVVASVRTDIRTFSVSGSTPVERRQVYPVIDFIPNRHNKATYAYTMQPGELINALAEWSYQRPEDGKSYTFILVAGSYLRRDGITRRGRITFLQPKSDRSGVKAAKTRDFEDPVWAVAMLDDSTYVAAAGNSIVVSRFDVNMGRMESLCEPLKLASRGICITADGPDNITVSTARDSTVRLQLRRIPGERERYELIMRTAAPQAAVSLQHATLETAEHGSVTILSTREGELYGFVSPGDSEDNVTSDRTSSSRLVFGARLPQSLVRLRQGSIRPVWQPPIPAGVIKTIWKSSPERSSAVVATSAGGSLAVVLLLSGDLWRRLFWLQRLVEWDSELSPAPHRETYLAAAQQESATTASDSIRISRLLPAGIAAKPGSSAVVPLSVAPMVPPPQDKHIDGDVLARLIKHPAGPRAKLRSILLDYAKEQQQGRNGDTDVDMDRSDASIIGEWVYAHLDEELQAVDGIVAEVEALVEGWM